MGEIYFSAICSTISKDWALWSDQIIWDTRDPDITLCFQYTILNWVPLLFLWVSGFIYVPLLWKKRTVMYYTLGTFNIFKTMVLSFLLIIHISNLTNIIIEDVIKLDAPPALYIQSILSSTSTILLIYMNRLVFLKGIHTSGVLFFYWMMQLVASFIIIYSRYRRIKKEDRDIFRTVTATLEFILVFISFITNCFADQTVFTDSDHLLSPQNSEDSQSCFEISESDKRILCTENPCPEAKASFPSKHLFIWLTGIMIKGYRRPLTFDDLYVLMDEFSASKIVPKVVRKWNQCLSSGKSAKMKARIESRTKMNYQLTSTEDYEGDQSNLDDIKDIKQKGKYTGKHFFSKALLQTIAYPYAISGILKITSELFFFPQAIFLGIIVRFIENPSEHIWHGIFYSICLFIVSMSRSITRQKFYYYAYNSGMMVRTASIGIIYRKALKLSTSSRKGKTVGEIVNLMSVDSFKIQEALLFLHNIWSGLINMTIGIVVLWKEIGFSIFALITILLFIGIGNYIATIKIKKLQVIQMKIKDNRMQLLSIIIRGIKVLKLFAWEKSFGEKAENIRNEECKILRSANNLYIFTALSWFCAPYIIALCCFAIYVLSSPVNVITPSKAFVALPIIIMISCSFSLAAGTSNFLIPGYVSLHRINKFLLHDELDDNTRDSSSKDLPVKIINGTFSWSKGESPVLKNINVEFEKESLVAVVGPVGSGKTSLSNALLGEMIKVSGTVECRGSIAYVPQITWCQNASIQVNILFNKPMISQKYERVIEACSLSQDLKNLPAADQTEIGEKSINLSGGQRQRINLARAVYQDSSIYILDDPLSAVDSKVGKDIFDQVIGPSGLLSRKTRILITSGVAHLPKVDKIFLMNQGQVIESGTYQELLNSSGYFAEFIRTCKEQENGISEESKEVNLCEYHPNENEILKGSGTSSSVLIKRKKSQLREKTDKESGINGRIIEEEIVKIGGIESGVFLTYIKAFTYPMAFIFVLSYISYLCLAVIGNIFLGYWAEMSYLNGTTTVNKFGFYFDIYSSLGAGQVVLVVILILGMSYGMYFASISLHHTMLTNILHAPHIFFETTPIGRIMYRFGKDLDIIDSTVFPYVRLWLISFAGIMIALVVITITSLYFLIILTVVLIIFGIIYLFYITTSRQFRRFYAIKESPLYSHFEESLSGLSIIRAYGVSEKFIEKCDALTDDCQRAWYLNITSYRWVQMGLEIIGNIIILLASVLIVMNSTSIGPGLGGLSLSLSLQIIGNFNFLLRTMSDLECTVIAIERIKEYTKIAQEAPWEISETKPNKSWPNRGEIIFLNYSVRYRPGLDLVLRDLNFVVKAGEKFGVVGRTGAGKSSLALALFRLIEPAEGTILIDGVDISTIGLHDLRTKISIIPQDPTLIFGSLRLNLDPLNQHSDEEIWAIIELTHLKPLVLGIAGGLDSNISENGDCFSVGQKQLFCLARVLLRRTKILVLDEATSSVDLETDEMIQASLRSQFKDCTVLTIAHRLNTIMDYDRVMVLEDGQIKELDTPRNLLANTESLFFSMAQNAGLV